jgi:membrane fusion protein (multidrug efflux system)
MKKWIIAIVALLAVIGILAGIKALQIGAMMDAGASYQVPPESVTTAPVQEAEWQPSVTSVGTIIPLQAVTISSELPGIARFVGFESSATVKRGQVLVKLDTAIEEAQLASAIADVKLAEVSLQRAKSLRELQANTPAELDAAEARSAQAAAALKNIEVTIAKKTIVAPFEGRLGMRAIEPGQVVAPGTPIATLQSIDPIYAEFALPQHALASIELGQAAKIHTDAFPGQAWEGKVSTINSEIDIASRNVRLRATFPNADGKLRPGMYVNVEVLMAQKQKVLNIPSVAVVYAPYGDSVYVVETSTATGKPQKVARQRFVRLGERRGDYVSVLSGLDADEAVITTGAFKLRNGAPVVENNQLAPKIEVNPKPEDT